MRENTYFTKEDWDEIKYLCDSGTYGIMKHSVENQIAKKGRIGYLWSRIFLPYKLMVKLCPIIRSIPALLPVFWVVRLVNAFIFKRAKMMYQFKAVFARQK